MQAIMAIAAVVISLLVGSNSAIAQGSRLAILMPGAGGVHPNDFMVRNEGRIRAAGIDTVVTTSPSQAASIAQAETAKGRKVVIAGMSRGAAHAAAALAAGAKVNGVVFVSGVFGEVRANLGSPALLPRTLVVHHVADACPATSPELAKDFVQWAQGKAAIRWINTRGTPVGRNCGPRGAHGFFMQDGPAVAAIVGFIRSR
ncbi:MAG TPA: hypothetical protein VIH40_09240 [Xanthobacteraceae bacterium]